MLSPSWCLSFSSAFSLQFHILWFLSSFFLSWYFLTVVLFGYAVAQSVESLRYTPKGREFYSRCDYFGCTVVLGSTQPLEYQGYLVGTIGGRCVGLKTLPHWCDDCVEILGASDSCNFKVLCRPVYGLLCHRLVTYTYTFQCMIFFFLSSFFYFVSYAVSTVHHPKCVNKPTRCTKFLWLDFIFH